MKPIDNKIKQNKARYNLTRQTDKYFSIIIRKCWQQV